MIPRIIGHYPDGRPIYQIAGGDNVTVDNGDLSDFTASTDTAASGEVQRVKLTYSADASDTHIDADADGLKVNVAKAGTITPGTAATSRKVTDGTVGATDVGVMTLVERDDSLDNMTAADGEYTQLRVDSSGRLYTSVAFASTINSGTNLIGRTQISDGTVATGDAVTASVIDTGGTNDALAVSLIDSSGDALAFAKPVELTATGPTVSTTPAYTANDSLDSTIISWANATVTAAGSGWISKVIIVDVDNEASDLELWFINQSGVTPPTENDAFNPSDADAAKVTAIIDTSTGTWYSYANGSVCIVPVSPPMPFKLASGTTLYAMAKVLGTPTYTASTDLSIKLHILQD